MSWLSLVLVIMKFINTITEYLRDQRIIKAAEAEATSRILEAARNQADEIKRQMDAAARAATPPVGVPVDKDPYQRD
jgi:hypothetical protein